MTISSSIGPISGINYGQLITGLTALDQQPIDKITTHVANIAKQSDALNSLAADMTGLQLSAASFTSAAIFNAVTATSANPSVVTATAGPGTAVGSYTFNVQRLATSSQLVSQGYADPTKALNVAGNLTFQIGGANLQNTIAQLSDLNGGSGVARGSIRVTDRAGTSSTIDLSNAVDLNDVVTSINSNQNLNLNASIEGDHLKIIDNSTGTGTLSITNVGSSTTASDLGLTGSAAANTLTGTDINKLSLTTSLNALNDGLGVRNAGVQNDFTITPSSGSPISVSLNGAKTIGDVLKAINTAGNVSGTQVVTASLSADGHGITLTAADAGALSVASANGSQAAQDLGLLNSSVAGTLTGSRLNAGLNSPLLSQLNGGSGVKLGKIAITNHNGAATAVDLSNAKTVNDVLNLINQSGAGVTAAVNSAGNGIALTDTTGTSTGKLSVTDTTGAAAHDLGLLQSTSASSINSSDLHLRTLSNNTQLSSLNGGTGFSAGKFKLADSSGASFVVDLTSSSITSIGDVLTQINQAASAGSIGIHASINANGNGILLTDTAGKNGVPSISETNGGKTAASLGLTGAFSTASLNSGSLLPSLSNTTPLSTLNGGSGFNAGKILLTDSTGAAATVDLSASITIGDVISQINKSTNGIRAALNSTGTGLLLTDSTHGSSTASVAEVSSGSTAASLHLLGNFAPPSLDGSFQKTINVTTADTLQTIQGKINTAGLGVNASIINDGSAGNPFRLALVSKNSGAAGQINFDGSSLGINTSTLVQAQNAVVRYGSGANALTAVSTTNSLGSIVPGLSVSLTGTGTTTVAVGRDDSQITTNVQGFVTAYNKIQTDLAADTKFNASDSTQNGVLFGNSTAQQIQQALGAFVAKSYPAGKSLTTLASVGITVGQDGTLTLNSATFQNALSNSPADLRSLFTTNIPPVAAIPGSPATATKAAVLPTAGSPASYGIGATLNQLISGFNDAQTGMIFRATDALTAQTTELNTRATFLNTLLQAKKNTLIQSFANLESNIAVLQNQGKAITGMSTTTSTSTSSSSG